MSLRHFAVDHLHAFERVRAGLERGVPVGMIDIDRPHFDAVFAQVAHDLRRRVEPMGCALSSAPRTTSG
jgi:hypothetical protein